MRDKSLISFRLDNKKKDALDSIAKSLDRDRSFVIDEAIKAYLELNDWMLMHIDEGIRDADTGKFASPAKVTRELKKWR